MSPMYLRKFSALARSCRESGYGFEEFRTSDIVIELGWPDDVAEQWLYDHAGNSSFLEDYGSVNLTRIRWDVETIPHEAFLTMPTGPSDGDYIEEIAANPIHYISVRCHGTHVGVQQCWEIHGTWKRWPILIDSMLLDPPIAGLQVIEGRTRVGVLRGLLRLGHPVARQHLTWVGRALG